MERYKLTLYVDADPVEVGEPDTWGLADKIPGKVQEQRIHCVTRPNPSAALKHGHAGWTDEMDFDEAIDKLDLNIRQVAFNTSLNTKERNRKGILLHGKAEQAMEELNKLEENNVDCSAQKAKLRDATKVLLSEIFKIDADKGQSCP